MHKNQLQQSSIDQIPESLKDDFGDFLAHKEDFDLFMGFPMDRLHFMAELDEKLNDFESKDTFKPLYVESLIGLKNLDLMVRLADIGKEFKEYDQLEKTLWGLILRSYSGLQYIKHNTMQQDLFDPGDEIIMDEYFSYITPKGVKKIIQIEESYRFQDPVPDSFTVIANRPDLLQDVGEFVVLSYRKGNVQEKLGKFLLEQETFDQLVLHRNTELKIENKPMEVNIKLDNPFGLARYPYVSVTIERCKEMFGNKYKKATYEVFWNESKVAGRVVSLGNWIFNSESKEGVVTLQPARKNLVKLAEKLQKCFPDVELFEIAKVMNENLQQTSRNKVKLKSIDKIKIPDNMSRSGSTKGEFIKDFLTCSVTHNGITKMFNSVSMYFDKKTGAFIYTGKNTAEATRIKSLPTFERITLDVDLSTYAEITRKQKMATPHYSRIVEHGKTGGGLKYKYQVIMIPTQGGYVFYPVDDNIVVQKPELIGDRDQEVEVFMEGTNYLVNNIYLRRLINKDGDQEALWYFHGNIKSTAGAFDCDDYIQDAENCDYSTVDVTTSDGKGFGEIDYLETIGDYTFLWGGHMAGGNPNCDISELFVIITDAYNLTQDVLAKKPEYSSSKVTSSYNRGFGYSAYSSSAYSKSVEPKRKQTAIFL